MTTGTVIATVVIVAILVSAAYATIHHMRRGGCSGCGHCGCGCCEKTCITVDEDDTILK